MMRQLQLTLSCLAAAALCACGGGGTSSGSSTTTSTPQRGQLLTNPPAQQASAYGSADILGLLALSSIGEQLLQLSLSPVCTVTIYHMEYETVGAMGEATTASAALMIPSGSASACQGPRPIVMYAHGTTPDQTFNIADLSRSDNDEGLLLTAVFASQGYIVVAPNYAGYDTSTLGYHPYLDAEQQSDDMTDALAAARSALSGPLAPPVSDNHKLFITGYSQGGFVAMATARAMQAAGQTVTAAGPMSGPYALAAFGDAVFEGEPDLSATENVTLLLASYQHAYGNIYTTASDVFAAQYANGIESLLPSTTPITTLYSQGLLPENALFSSTPPASQYASITPATSPAELAPAFALGFGDPALVTNTYRLSYLQDAAAAPDGGFPTVTTGIPAASPGNTLRQALKTNDLRNWVPTSPVMLCGGNSDPTVFFFDTQLMQDYWTANPPTTPLTILDVDSSATSGDPYATIKQIFADAKTAMAVEAVADGATDGGALAVLQAYHATLVPPACISAVKTFFDGY
jgi:Prolyl oligopeptidase family